MEFIIGIGESWEGVTDVYTLDQYGFGLTGFAARRHCVSDNLVPFLKVGQLVYFFIDDFVVRRVEIIDELPDSCLDFIHFLFKEYSPVVEDVFDE